MKAKIKQVKKELAKIDEKIEKLERKKEYIKNMLQVSNFDIEELLKV